MKQKFKNTQKGITLVALVITIIVLLILAMVSIKIVVDGGLITKASKATDTHTIGAEKEAIGLGYSEYQMALANKENVTRPTIKGAEEVTPKGEGWNVKFTKTNNEYQLSKDGSVLLAKQNGIDVIWTDNGDDTFTKGDVTLKVGDIVNYDEGTGYSTTVTASQSGYTKDRTYTTENVGWRVLGINSKGELELISDNPTGGLTLCDEIGYLNAERILNNVCKKLYGQGTYATGARSLNVDDINKLANYDPTTFYGYRGIWTYRFPTSGEYMQYKITKADGTLVTDWTDITDANHQTFRVPGEKETETINVDNRNDTGKSLESTYYSYTVADKVTQITSNGEKMSDIISNGTGSSNVTQWLASRCVNCFSGFADCEVRFVYNYVGGHGLYYTFGTHRGNASFCVRPVVSLESNIQLSGNSTDGWTIN